MKTAKEAINEIFGFRAVKTKNDSELSYSNILAFCKDNDIIGFNGKSASSNGNTLRYKWCKAHKFIVNNGMREKLYSDMNWKKYRGVSPYLSYDKIVDICKKNNIERFADLKSEFFESYVYIRNHKLSEKLHFDMNWIQIKKSPLTLERVMSEIDTDKIKSFGELLKVNPRLYKRLTDNKALRAEVSEYTGWVIGARYNSVDEEVNAKKKKEYLKNYYEEKRKDTMKKRYEEKKLKNNSI